MNPRDIVESLKEGSEANKQARQFETEVKNTFHQYNENYRKRHGQPKVMCVGMDAPIPLDDVYVDVQFLKQRQALQHASRENVENSEEALRERSNSLSTVYSDEKQDGMRVANDKPYLMVIGGPGAGKSTFLRKIGLEALKGKDGNFEHKCIPVFLELKGFTGDSINIKDMFIDELEICNYPPDQNAMTALESGKFLILLDGLDEAPFSNFNNVVREIGNFVSQYSQNRFIVSSRIAVNIREFTDVEIADFDDLKIERYINNWFASASDPDQHHIEERKKNAEQCWKALNAPEHQAFNALARNPLLLTLLCIFYDDKQKFPRNRTELYERVLNIFLEEWSDEKLVSRDSPVNQYLDLAIVEKILFEIAARNLEENCLLFKKKDLTNQIKVFGERSTNTLLASNARKILDTILVDPGLFVERFRGVYSFPHLTFQEYLTANYFVNTESIQRLVTEHLHNERWREVFLFTAELLPEADDLLVAMETEATKFINTDKLKTLFGWATRITNTSDNRYDKIAKRIFAIRQYFSLWLLNETYMAVQNNITQHPDPNQNFDQNRYLGLHVDRDLDGYLYRKYRKGSPDIYHRRKHYRYRELDSYLDFYLNLNVYVGHKLAWGLNQYLVHNLDRELDSECYRYKELSRYFNYYRRINNYLDPYFHQDPYQYMDIDFYRLASSRLGDWFEDELKGRIMLLKHIGQLKIFKRVNLQWMVGRFNAQRKFIKAVMKGEVIEPPAESIHDTWLSVLGITDDMLAISREEMESYIQYLRAIQLILACKEAARRVSPDVWNRIEDRFLTVDLD